jgi:hypothetical protein
MRKSAKETDAEQGSFLTAMGSEEGEKSSSSSIKKKYIKNTMTGELHYTRQNVRRGEDSCMMKTRKGWPKSVVTQDD